MSVIFTAHLDSNLTEFTGEDDGASQLAWSEDATAKAVCTTAGAMKLVIASNTLAQCYKSGLANTSHKVRARFYIDPNALTMATNNSFYLLDLIYGAGTIFAQVVLRWDGSNFVTRLYAINDEAGEVNTTSTTLSDAPHYIEIYVTREVSNGSNDGTASIWVDGGSQKDLTGIGNYARFTQLDIVQLGATGGIDTGTRGTFYLDELIVNDDGGAIGAYSSSSSSSSTTSSSTSSSSTSSSSSTISS